MPKSTLLHLIFSAFLLFSESTLASPIHHNSPSSTPGISCAKWVLPVTAAANNLKFDVPRVDNNIDAINYAWDQDTWSHPNITLRTQSILPVSDTFGIGVQLCVPSGGQGKSDILQIATHGLGFDKRYWDVELEPESYSYVRAAVKAGYSILTYDRLGTGYSDKADAYDIVQAPLQLEILKEITTLARNGKLANAAKPHFAGRVALPNFTKTVHIGHSFGSALTNALLAKYPDVSDGAIQTGWLVNPHLGSYGASAFGYQYAAENDPNKFSDRPSGYIIVGTQSSFQQLFLSETLVDPKLLEYGNGIKQPGTVGEGGPTGTIVGLPATNFTGPLQIFLAEYDYPVCTGDCKGVYDIAQLKASSFPRASALDVYIQPGTGNGFTLHKNATAGYKVMFDFLGKNGL